MKTSCQEISKPFTQVALSTEATYRRKKTRKGMEQDTNCDCLRVFDFCMTELGSYPLFPAESIYFSMAIVSLWRCQCFPRQMIMHFSLWFWWPCPPMCPNAFHREPTFAAFHFFRKMVYSNNDLITQIGLGGRGRGAISKER